jgi:hypothetical protein
MKYSTEGEIEDVLHPPTVREQHAPQLLNMSANTIMNSTENLSLTSPYLVMTFYETRRFITAFTRVLYLSQY